jgi:hypothetical protein
LVVVVVVVVVAVGDQHGTRSGTSSVVTGMPIMIGMPPVRMVGDYRPTRFMCWSL